MSRLSVARSRLPILRDDSDWLQEGSFDCSWDVNRNEAVSGEEVVLSAFVDHALISVAFGVIVS